MPVTANSLPITRTWSDAAGGANQTVTETTLTTQAQGMLYEMKVAMVAAGWTVVASSNASVANSSDNWSGPSSLTWSAASARSWIVLSKTLATTKTVYVMLSCSVANVYQFVWRVSTAAFTSMSSTTANPSNTIGTERTITFLDSASSPSAIACRYHARCTSSGDVAFVITKVGGGFPIFHLFFNALSNYDTGTQYPFVCWARYNVSTPGPWDGSAVYSAPGSGSFLVFDNSGADQAASTTGPCAVSGPNGRLQSLMPSSGNPVSGYLAGWYVPITFGANGAVLGSLTDVYAAPQGSGNNAGDEIPNATPTEFANAGGLWVPSGGTAWLF